MRKKPKWWALILALVLLAGSGVAAYKFHSFGGRFDGRYGGFDKFGVVSKLDMHWDDDDFNKRGRMGSTKGWDDDEWEHGRGHGRSFQYKMSDDDLNKTPEEYAKAVAESSFGEGVEVAPLEIEETGVMAFQVIKDNELVQILIVDTEEKLTTFMYR